MAFPFEALEVFTYQLKKVATSRYVGDNAPTGLLATLNGLAGCMHYAFGKGMILKGIVQLCSELQGSLQLCSRRENSISKYLNSLCWFSYKGTFLNHSHDPLKAPLGYSGDL